MVGDWQNGIVPVSKTEVTVRAVWGFESLIFSNVPVVERAGSRLQPYFTAVRIRLGTLWGVSIRLDGPAGGCNPFPLLGKWFDSIAPHNAPMR